KTSKIKKNKIKLRSKFEDDEEQDDDDIDSITIKKTPIQRKKKGLSIPLFHNLDDPESNFGSVETTFEDLKKTSAAQFKKPDPIEDEPVVVELDKKSQSPSPEQDFISLNDDEKPHKQVTFDTKEYISVLSPNDGPISPVDEDTEMNEETYTELDDGRLPLSDREATLQKKMHDMEIKEAIYDLEISEDEEMDDWTATKVKQGELGTNGASKSTAKRHMPKLTLFQGDTFQTQRKQIDDMLLALKTTGEGSKNALERLQKKKLRYQEQMESLKKRLEDIGSEL
ncbi:hypothetical protein BON22_1765, partial [Cyberlindnera fabianii]